MAAKVALLFTLRKNVSNNKNMVRFKRAVIKLGKNAAAAHLSLKLQRHFFRKSSSHIRSNETPASVSSHSAPGSPKNERSKAASSIIQQSFEASEAAAPELHHRSHDRTLLATHQTHYNSSQEESATDLER